MTADEYLEKTKKAPWQSEEGNPDNPFWYWATEIDYNGPLTPEDYAEDEHMILPLPIWNHLRDKTTYPYVKMYWTREAALQDFRQAFDKAVEEGWQPG